MLSDIRIEVHPEAVAALLKSDEVRDWVVAAGERVADQAGPGFGAKAFYGRDRVSAIVRPETSEALTAYYDDSTVLTSALGAAGSG